MDHLSLLKTIKFITNHPLNRGRKIDAVLRFVKWQIGSRLVPGAIVFDWIGGAKFLVETGETGLTGNIYTGLHEFADMGFLLHFLRKEDLFVDVGANVGSYTILAGSCGGARSIAFEPVPSTYSKLLNNVRLNCLDANVKCINVGLGSEPGVIDFTCDVDTMNHVVAPGEVCEKKVSVNVTTLDIALNGACPSLLKIDVEGYEAPVVEGAQETLKNKALNAVIMELNGGGGRYGFIESKILETMIAFGFKTYEYNPLDRKLVDRAHDNLKSGNALFVRNVSFVNDRLRSAPLLNVFGKVF